MSSVRTSLAYSLVDNYLGVVLQLASTLIISRLLTPDEVGIFAVAAVLAALASTFRDFGVAEYLIQAKELTAERIRAALAANIAISWFMAAVMTGSSGWVADFYRQPGIAEVMRVQAISFLLIPFGAVTIAFFRRELNYRPIFIANLMANISTFFVAVGAALAGLGYMSLAWSSLAGVLVTVLASLFMRPKTFPRWPSFSGIAEVIAFGKHASGIYLFGQIGKGAPEAIIGRALDMASVAFFSRANGLLELFNRTVLRAVLPVCLPYFSEAARSGAGVKSGYLKASSLLTGIGWPFFAVMGLLAFSAVRILYGPQWMPAVALAQILCVVGMLELPYYLATEVMIAQGRVDQSNRLQFFVQSLRVLGLMLAFPFGLVGACWGLVAAGALGAVVSHRFLHQTIGLRFSDVLKTLAPGVAVAAATATGPALVLSLTAQTEFNYLLVFAGCSLLALLTWLPALRLLRHPLWQEVAGVARQVSKKLRPAAH